MLFLITHLCVRRKKIHDQSIAAGFYQPRQSISPPSVCCWRRPKLPNSWLEKKNSKTKDMIHYCPSCRSLRFAFGENRLHRIGGVFRTGPLVFVLLCGCLRSTGLHLHRTIVVVEKEIVRMEGGKQHHVPKHFKPNFPVLTRCRRCVNEVLFCWPPNIQVE